MFGLESFAGMTTSSANYPRKAPCMLLWRHMLRKSLAYPLSWNGNANSQHQARYDISL
jgi:hypothetical protein